MCKHSAAPCLKPRFAALRRLNDPTSSGLLDEGLVIFFPAPRSQTGEDMAELHVHGGRAVIQAALAALSRFPDCRAAEPGEFAARAFSNGKLDLAQIEGLADLIDAETEMQRQQAIAEVTGAQSTRFESWRKRLLEGMGLVEAAIDFSDEADVSSRAVNQAAAMLSVLHTDLAAHLDDGHRGEIAREGFRVVLAGAPNAGKSSLLNALARRPAAIVSSQPGTTRDVIEVRLDLAGYAVIVSDTAGIRDTASEIEREGIARSHAAMRLADLVLWLIDLTDAADQKPLSAVGSDHVHIYTKADLAPAADLIHVKHPALAISAQTGTGLDELTRLIAERASTAVGKTGDPAITRARHRHEIASAVAHLDAFAHDDTRPLELRAEDLRLAGNALGRLVGRIDAEEVLGEIFSRFCIGK